MYKSDPAMVPVVFGAVKHLACDDKTCQARFLLHMRRHAFPPLASHVFPRPESRKSHRRVASNLSSVFSGIMSWT